MKQMEIFDKICRNKLSLGKERVNEKTFCTILTLFLSCSFAINLVYADEEGTWTKFTKENKPKGSPNIKNWLMMVEL